MATLQDRGRIALARALIALPIYLAWGRGSPAWDTAMEPEPTNAAGLADEIGRRLLTSWQYVQPAAAGAVLLPDGSRYSASATPTKWLHLRWTFDYADAAGQVVRELGIFLGGSLAPGLPAGQRYFTPAQVSDVGDLYALERFERWTRSSSTINAQEMVLPF